MDRLIKLTFYLAIFIALVPLILFSPILSEHTWGSGFVFTLLILAVFSIIILFELLAKKITESVSRKSSDNLQNPEIGAAGPGGKKYFSEHFFVNLVVFIVIFFVFIIPIILALGGENLL
jgi:hypothetical protein